MNGDTTVFQPKFTFLSRNSCGLSIRSEVDSACDLSVLGLKTRYPLLCDAELAY
jgi:hypothetical protein